MSADLANSVSISLWYLKENGAICYGHGRPDELTEHVQPIGIAGRESCPEHVFPYRANVIVLDQRSATQHLVREQSCSKKPPQKAAPISVPFEGSGSRPGIFSLLENAQSRSLK